MFRFDRDQVSYSIGGVRVGGQPGSTRTLLLGSLFYPGHGIVRDRSTGSVDVPALEDILSRLDETSDALDTPHGVSLFAETPDAMVRHIDDVSGLFEGPMTIDSPSPEVRASGVRTIIDRGLEDRVILNSVGLSTSAGEIDAMGDADTLYAVALAFDPRSPDLKGRVHLLDDGGNVMDVGLLDRCSDWGVMPLIDVAVTSMGAGAGEALRAIPICKAKWGIPTGCCLLNALESWFMAGWLREGHLYRKVASSAIATAISSGADWVMYGPAEWGVDAMAVASFNDSLQRGMHLDR